MIILIVAIYSYFFYILAEMILDRDKFFRMCPECGTNLDKQAKKGSEEIECGECYLQGLLDDTDYTTTKEHYFSKEYAQEHSKYFLGIDPANTKIEGIVIKFREGMAKMDFVRKCFLEGTLALTVTDPEVFEAFKYAEIADAKTKGYKFLCSSYPGGCQICDKSLVSFVTQDLEEAFKHSLDNKVTMWVSKD